MSSASWLPKKSRFRDATITRLFIIFSLQKIMGFVKSSLKIIGFRNQYINLIEANFVKENIPVRTCMRLN